MPNLRILKENTSLPHFITLTTVHWYYLFDRLNRWQILADALQFQIKKHNLTIYAYVFMLNHLHMILSAPDLIGVIRDFKKFTTYQIKLSLCANEPRVLNLLKDEKDKFQLWQPDNMPIVIESKNVLLEKLNYIHNNPVKKQYVDLPEYWHWSSANPNSPIPIAPID